MELEFLLPYIDELKRLTGSDTKVNTSKSTALDRFYSSDLFDSNVLGIIDEFIVPYYKVTEDNTNSIKFVTFIYRHISIDILIACDDSFTDMKFSIFNEVVVIYLPRKREIVERNLFNGICDNLTKHQSIIKKSIRWILADPSLFP